MMRTMTTTLMLALVAALPAAAQLADTSIMIMNKDCTVKVNGKRLPAADEKKACDQVTAATGRLRNLDWQFGQNQSERVAGEELARGMRSRGLQERALSGQLRAGVVQERALSGQLRAAEEGVRGLTERAMVAIAGRPRFGITIDTRPRDTDKWGAYITAVTPAGPADKAGIRSGDIITKLGGKAISAQGDEPPGVRLIAMIGELEPNKSVDVQLRRGNDTKSVKVTPSNDETFFAGPMNDEAMRRVFSFEASPIGVMPARGRNMDSALIAIARRNGDPLTAGSYSFTVNGVNVGGPLAALEMTSLNAGLGAYFGATEGVLIINTGEKQELGLLPGDVVTAVDGRKVTSPGQLARILRTYEKGEEYKLQVMRQKRTETVTGKMP